jgi:hypothetical protein
MRFCRKHSRCVSVTLSVLDIGVSTVLLSQFSVNILSSILQSYFLGESFTLNKDITFPCTIFNGTAYYNSSSTNRCSILPVNIVFTVGGSTVDLWLLSIVRTSLVLFSIVLANRWKSNCCCYKTVLFKWRWGIVLILITILQILYLIIKALLRLIDGVGSGSPSAMYFWSLMGATAFFSLPQLQFLLYIIHDNIHWQETAATTIDSELNTVSNTTGMLQQPLLTHSFEEASKTTNLSNDRPDNLNLNIGENSDDDEIDEIDEIDEDELEIERKEFENMNGKFAGILSEQYQMQDGIALKTSAVQHTTENSKGGAIIVSSSSGYRPSCNGKSSLAWYQKKNSKKKQSRGASIWKLIQLGKVDLPWLLTAFVALLIAAIGQAYIPLLTGNLINEIHVGKNLETLKSNTKQLAITAFVTAVSINNIIVCDLKIFDLLIILFFPSFI